MKRAARALDMDHERDCDDRRVGADTSLRGAGPIRSRRVVRILATMMLVVVLATCTNPMDGGDPQTSDDPHSGSDPVPGDDPGDQPTLAEEVLAAMQGDWLSSESVTYYDRELTLRYELAIRDQDVELRVTVLDPAQAPGEEAVNVVTVSGRLAPSPTVVSFSYSSGTQAVSNGDATFNTAAAQALNANEIATLEAELGGSQTITIETDRFVLDQGLVTERVYERL